jgi:hypothetical protein
MSTIQLCRPAFADLIWIQTESYGSFGIAISRSITSRPQHTAASPLAQQLLQLLVSAVFPGFIFPESTVAVTLSCNSSGGCRFICPLTAEQNMIRVFTRQLCLTDRRAIAKMGEGADGPGPIGF